MYESKRRSGALRSAEMKRDLSELSRSPFDVLVVGAGIHGACAAWDAAQRGLRVAVVDRNDFGAATSANSLKVIHGGLRYLQSMDLRRMRRSIQDRSALLKVAPHLVRPLGFLVPTSGLGMESRAAFRTAFTVTRLVGFDQNRGVPSDRRISNSRVLDRGEALRLAPALERPDMTGGALWYDAQCVNTERLTLAFLQSAAEAGAVVANHVNVESLVRSDRRVIGGVLRDGVTGNRFRVQARVVLNAGGPYAGKLEERARSARVPLGLAMNLVVRSLGTDVAFGVRSRVPLEGDPVGGGNRFLFFVPWKDRTILGTFYRPHRGPIDAETVGIHEVQQMLDECNEAVKELDLTLDDVRLVHKGLVPLQGGRRRPLALATDSRVVDHEAEDGIQGLVSVIGVKYTTARAVAERAVDLIFRKLGVEAPPCRTRVTPVWGGERHLRGDGSSTLESRMDEGYGGRTPEVQTEIDAIPDGWKPVATGSTLVRGEVLRAVRKEMALTLSDVVMRRTGVGATGHPGTATVDAVSRVLADELGWTDRERTAEIEALNRIYRPLNTP